MAEAAEAARVKELLVFSDGVAIRGGSLEEIREIANEVDLELMKSLAERQGPVFRGAPRSEATVVQWQERVERAKQQIGSLGDVKEGSIEMGFKNDRLKALADRPPAF